ncbi:hypothetical protein QBC35DRAFT_504023 [Podospora australis]|uniref:Zn(2)-C6 fungal-type domain-containing protein n=1 Tax=Podospora australis TaxID=1536484 RepID=A0AAN6WN98_9PEZI|nr:hypothetical protein QBC35DRAFT_504023 [Podospora australis]
MGAKHQFNITPKATKMVYGGKPSTGCQMCRTRRIKCDEKRPTCNQCFKARRQCPGYRDHFDLLLRSENLIAERRALGGGKQTGTKKKTRSWPLPSPSSYSNPVRISISRSLSIPTTDLATCHFLSNYVLIPRREENSARGFLNFLIPLLDQQEEKHLKHAFNACALASLSGRVLGGGSGGRKESSVKGFGEYTKALRSIQAALQDPTRCKEDSVLAAVLLLGMFEKMTATQLSGSGWGSHVEGAVQIVKARGREQLRTKLGLQLFIAVRTQLIIHTLTSATAPTMGTEWWISDTIQDSTAAACQRLNLLTAELRAEVHHAMAENNHHGGPQMTTTIELISSFIRRAQALDAQVSAWLSSLPPNWQFKTVYFSRPRSSGTTTINYTEEEVYPGRVDTYPDFWIASLYNMARTARLILMSITVRCAAWVCSPVDYRTTPEYAVASRQCVEIIGDILASVPFHLGWHAIDRPESDSQEDTQEKGGFACGQETEIKALAGYFLTWPLACVLSQDFVSDTQRQYVQGRLRFIGAGLGFKYSHILSQLQVRVPSMLIHRDRLLATPSPIAHDLQKLIREATRAPSVSGDYRLNPLQQREAYA